MEIHNMKVLSIDDNQNNLMMIEVFAKKLNLIVESFESPIVALDRAQLDNFDIVIVDYMMPKMNGIEFIKHFREIDPVTPIVMVTAVGDNKEIQIEALESGATDFLSKPINYAVFTGRVRNLLKLKKAHLMLEEKAESLEEQVRQATVSIVEREHETLRVLSRTTDYKDPETGSHLVRVASYTKIIAKKYGLSDELQDTFFHAAPLHDIGKVGIQDHILLKPGKFTGLERLTMMEHPLIGFNILKNSKSEYLRAGGIIAFTHHEKFDGTGYPKQLVGEAIPLVGRIVAVADVFDALTSKRPYKKAWSFEAGMAHIQSESGKHFDPEIAKIFQESEEEVRAIYNKYSEDHEFNVKY